MTREFQEYAEQREKISLEIGAIRKRLAEINTATLLSESEKKLSRSGSTATLLPSVQLTSSLQSSHSGSSQIPVHPGRSASRRGRLVSMDHAPSSAPGNKFKPSSPRTLKTSQPIGSPPHAAMGRHRMSTSAAIRPPALMSSGSQSSYAYQRQNSRSILVR